MTAVELEQLLPDAEQLPDPVRDRVLGLGEAAHAAIAELVRRKVQALQEHSESNLGWRAHHAVRLAGALRVHAAIPPLLDVFQLDHSDPDLVIFDDASVALEAMGAAVLEPLLARWDQFDVLLGPGGVLGTVGRGDDRAFQRLAKWFEDEPEYAASALANLGDARAIPLIRERLSTLRPNPAADMFDNRESIELAGALEELRCELLPEELQKVAVVKRLLRLQVRIGWSMPGRDDP